ncbi:hypothetical protein CR513_27885, partial [Mucuna pruriens]
MADSSSFVRGSLTVFNGKLFYNWRVKMLAVFGFQNVIELVIVGFVEPGRNATQEQRLIFKQQQKLDIPPRDSSTNDTESIANYFDRIQEMVIAMRDCKEKVTDQQVVDKILRILPPEFDYVVAIE